MPFRNLLAFVNNRRMKAAILQALLVILVTLAEVLMQTLSMPFSSEPARLLLAVLLHLLLVPPLWQSSLDALLLSDQSRPDYAVVEFL